MRLHRSSRRSFSTTSRIRAATSWLDSLDWDDWFLGCGVRRLERRLDDLHVMLERPPGVEADAAGVVLRFALPPGAYATVVLRELIGDEALRGEDRV